MSASEIIIFMFLGLELVSEEHYWHTGFVLWTLLLCTVFRFLITFGMASLINRFDTMRVRKIGYDEMFMIAFGGLRGAVAFSLAALLDEEELPMKRMFVTTTLVVVMFTVFFQGITIKPLVNFLSIRLAPEKNQSMYCELSSHVTDHLMAGIEDVVGKKGRNHIREKIELIDAEYMKKWLMNEPDPVDSSLQDFYTKIVIKEHYNNLKLCGAANVTEPSQLPHVDTNMYLQSISGDKDNALVAKETIAEMKEAEKEEDGTQLRHRNRASRRPFSNDLQGLRDLLKNQRNTHMNLRSTFDRNIVEAPRHSLQKEIAKKSAHNRRLQRLMSTTAHNPFLRCMSWTDRSAQIAVERSAEASGNAGVGASKRAVSVDMGSQAVSYRPLLSASPKSPATPVLDSVFEENEEGVSNPDQAFRDRTGTTDDQQSDEKQPLMSDIERPPDVAYRQGQKSTEDSSEGSAEGNSPTMKRKGQTSRKRLQRQDDLITDDTRPPSTG